VSAPTSHRVPALTAGQLTGLRAAFLPFLVVAVAHVVLLAIAEGMAGSRGIPAADAFAGATKPLLMPALLLAFIIALPLRRSAVAGLGAVVLTLSWLGDIALGTPDGPAFLVGLVLFLLAHVAWLVLISRHLSTRRPPALALVYVLWWGCFVALLAPHAGTLIVAVALYGLVLGSVAALALGSNRTVALGAALFVLSDSLLALHVFVPGFSPWQVDALIMSGYLAGQGLMVLGTLIHVRRAFAAGASA
jgi:uncharacterized membrane protein YhhN